MQIFYLYFFKYGIENRSPDSPDSPDTAFKSPAVKTEGKVADVSDTANLSVAVVGADPCVRPGNVNRVNHTIRFIRDKRT